MKEYEPRTHLPDEWAKKASCPVYQSRGLLVSHTSGPADRMGCPACQVSFEIAQGFTHIRLMRLPDQFISHRIDLIGVWINPIELKTIVDKVIHAAQFVESPLQPPAAKQESKIYTKSILSTLPKLTQEEATQRALNLTALGNPPQAIQVVLQRAGASSEQTAIALEELTRVNQKKTKHQTRCFGSSLVR